MFVLGGDVPFVDKSNSSDRLKTYLAKRLAGVSADPI